MNIQTVIANLLNTIEGKEKLLGELKRRKGFKRLTVDQMAFDASVNFLEINLNELNNILHDCMAVREADIVRNLESKEELNNTGWEH